MNAGLEVEGIRGAIVIAEAGRVVPERLRARVLVEVLPASDLRRVQAEAAVRAQPRECCGAAVPLIEPRPWRCVLLHEADQERSLDRARSGQICNLQNVYTTFRNSDHGMFQDLRNTVLILYLFQIQNQLHAKWCPLIFDWYHLRVDSSPILA